MKTKIISILLITLLFLTGCSQDNGVQQTGSQEQTSASDSKEDIIVELETITSQEKQEYSVTYSEDIEGQGVVDVALYVKGKNMLVESGSSQGKVSLYFLETTAYMCTYQQAKWQCLTTGSEDKQESFADNMEYTWDDYNETSEDTEEFNIVRDGTITVAGTVAKCYKSEYENTTQRFCLSKEGIPLYNKMTENGEVVSEFEAKSYSNKVSDSKFALPEGAEIVDMNQLYGLS